LVNILVIPFHHNNKSCVIYFDRLASQILISTKKSDKTHFSY